MIGFIFYLFTILYLYFGIWSSVLDKPEKGAIQTGFFLQKKRLFLTEISLHSILQKILKCHTYIKEIFIGCTISFDENSDTN